MLYLEIKEEHSAVLSLLHTERVNTNKNMISPNPSVTQSSSLPLGTLVNKQTSYVCVGAWAVPRITNSQAHCEACKHYHCPINVELGHFDMVSLWQSQQTDKRLTQQCPGLLSSTPAPASSKSTKETRQSKYSFHSFSSNVSLSASIFNFLIEFIAQ